MTQDEELKLAAERLLILQKADAFMQLVDSPGWKEIYAVHVAWAEKYREAMAKLNTADISTTIEAVRQWQLAEEFLKLEADYINNILRQAQDIRGTNTVQDAILMEQAYEQTRPDNSPDRSGY